MYDLGYKIGVGALIAGGAAMFGKGVYDGYKGKKDFKKPCYSHCFLFDSSGLKYIIWFGIYVGIVDGKYVNKFYFFSITK